MSSFRAELAGLHDMLSYAFKHGNRNAEYEICCDNESVLKVLDPSKEPTIVELSRAEGKLVQQTRTILQKFRKVSLHHANGHQDDEVRYEDLDLQSRLNVDCDAEAKRKMRASYRPTGRPTPAAGHRATLHIDNLEVTTKMNEQLHYAIHDPQMFEYLCECLEWVDAQLSGVNWKAIGLAKRRLPHDQFIQTSKMMHLWLNIGKQKAHITKRAADTASPYFGHELEDQNHLYTCKHDKMAAAVTEDISKMEEALAAENMLPSAAIAFVERVQKVTGTLTDKRQIQCSAAKRARNLQDTLGSEAILRGHHHTAWVKAISRTYCKRVSPPGTNPKHRRKDKIARGRKRKRATCCGCSNASTSSIEWKHSWRPKARSPSPSSASVRSARLESNRTSMTHPMAMMSRNSNSGGFSLPRRRALTSACRWNTLDGGIMRCLRQGYAEMFSVLQN